MEGRRRSNAAVASSDAVRGDRSPPVDDAAIVARVLAGRTEDFALLVERYQRMIYAVSQRFLSDADLADEATQAAFVQAFTQLGRWRGEGSFKTWLHAIALNQCRGLARTRRAARTVSLDDVPESALPAAAADPRADDRAAVERLVADLPPRQRSVLALRVFSDLPFREIARAEGISENAAKVSFHHAVTRLRRWLAGERS